MATPNSPDELHAISIGLSILSSIPKSIVINCPVLENITTRLFPESATIMCSCGDMARPFIKSTGEMALQFGHCGNTNSTFNNPSYVATDGELILISDSGHHQVKVFHKSGKYIRKMGDINCPVLENITTRLFPESATIMCSCGDMARPFGYLSSPLSEP
jgi:hypothetical protein